MGWLLKLLAWAMISPETLRKAVNKLTEAAGYIADRYLPKGK